MTSLMRRLSKHAHVDDKGRALKDMDKIEAYKDREFVTHTVPDIRPNTRVVAICGITDDGDCANPDDDGWFLSDFFAFNYLMKGTCANQKWLSSEDPKALVQKYGSYLHGHPYLEKKVVLDQALFDNDQLSPVTVIPAHDMVKQFLDALERESTTATEQKQSLLVLIFGHGLEFTYNIWLGPDARLTAQELLDVNKDLSHPKQKFMLHREEFGRAIRANPRVTLLTTACYLGGWSIDLSLNLTTATAAGPEKYSESWAESPSIGRCCVSIYASAVLEALKEESDSVTSDHPPQAAGDREKTWAAFASTIRDVLFLRTDRFAYEHQIHFSAQDDDWEAAWRPRTGIPLRSFRLRWERLEACPPTADPSVGSNRDPANRFGVGSSTRLVQDFEQLSLSGTSAPSLRSRFGGFIKPARSHVRYIASIYLASRPGRSSLGWNVSSHGRIRKLFRDPEKVDWEVLESLYFFMKDRLSVTFAATKVLELAQVPFPKGLKCDEWEEHEDFWWQLTEMESQICNKIRSRLGDVRLHAAGVPFNKPKSYLAAAIFHMNLKGIREADEVVSTLESGRSHARPRPMKTLASSTDLFMQLLWRCSMPRNHW